MACGAPLLWRGPQRVRAALRARGLPPGVVDRVSCAYHAQYEQQLRDTYRWAGQAFMWAHFPPRDLHRMFPEDFPACM